MTISSKDKRVIQQVVKAHGPTLDLETHPEVLIEIVRKWGFDLLEEIPDAGVRPGGVSPVGPTSLLEGPRLDDILKAIHTLQRQVDKLTRKLEA
ncbi:hypothetical protein [Nocardia yamanashiensis]|uniref:hypothetical protein n=1 Tax=Nocardia yamanashiensis TaxID=209247 RepID=UPI0008360559|nr:hypothetical protein [Nocardia yamanashiensis]